MVDQLSFGWKAITFMQSPALYRGSQLIGDLPEHGPVAAWIYGQTVKHAAHNVCLLAAPSQLVQTSSSLKRTELLDGSCR
jgi:hypothetical protein